MSEPENSDADNHDVIYTLRTAHQSQTQLNLMADQKANILVGVIVVLFTILVTRIPDLQLAKPGGVWALAVFALLEITALLTAIMVIRPRAGYLKHSLDINDMPNPLFFGFFTRYSEQEYVDHMIATVRDNHSAREVLLRDYYQIGLVLRRKFTLLKLAYGFAAAGVVVATAWMFLGFIPG